MTTENGSTKAKKKFIHPKKTPEERKLEKQKLKLRKSRIILRNLPFKVAESDLMNEFSKFGEIKECNVLKRENGKLVGCAFIQYDKVNHAAKAIHHANGKELFGRPVIIDWAVNKKQFLKHLRQQKQGNAQVKTENTSDTEIKQESESDEDENGTDDESVSDNDDEVDGDEVDGQNDEESEDSEGIDDDGADDDDEDNEISEDEDVKDEKKPIHKKSNDVAEGCTVFIKNIPFECTNDDLYKVCRQFGPIYYAVITVDKISGHSKGNGFVKFKVTLSSIRFYRHTYTLEFLYIYD